MPRVLGDAVGLSPLLVLVAVAACGVIFGGLAVLLAIPVAAVLVTLFDVLVLKKDPGAEGRSHCDVSGEGCLRGPEARTMTRRFGKLFFR